MANEKALKNALTVDMKHQKQLHEAEVKPLNNRIDEFKDVQKKYMEKVLGGPSASQSVRTVHQNNRLGSHDNTPTDARHHHGRNDRSGSAHSPSH